LELGISVLSAALRGEATGAPEAFRGDVAAVAKRDLAAGERLDGEGGFTVWGKLLPAEDSLSLGALPIGLAQGVTLRRGLKAGEVLRRADVDLDEKDATIACRDEMESHFGPEG
jgi:predicted homoserine dehydrogenase-like protein